MPLKAVNVNAIIPAVTRPMEVSTFFETPRQEHMPRKRVSRILSVNAAEVKMSTRPKKVGD